MVAAGLAVALPEGGREPPPGDMETDVAPVTLQLRMELPPGPMLEGLAVKVITGNEAGGGEGGGAAATVTVTCRVAVPAALVAVSV